MDDLEIQKILLAGPSDARSLGRSLGISQPTLSRRMQGLLRTGEIVKFGRARSTRYALRRPIMGLPESEEIPLYEIDENGEAHRRGSITPIQPGGVIVSGNIIPALEGLTESVQPGLPCYLEYMRPEGFLGRMLCRKIEKESELPYDARYWTEDQFLNFLYRYGSDLPGSFLLGRPALESYLQIDTNPIAYKNIRQEYHRRALAAIEGEAPGSSAGRERSLPAGKRYGPAILEKDGRR